MVTQKIAISGKASSGKDTLAQLLMTQLKKDSTTLTSTIKVKTFAFADPIKEIVLQMFPETSSNILWGPSANRSKIIPGTVLTYRQLLLNLGKFGREIDSSLWINATLETINSWTSHRRISAAIISDCRFRDEFIKLKQENYYLIRVIRPNNDYATEQPLLAQDVSETDLDIIPDSEFDLVIANDSTLDDLKHKMKIASGLILDHQRLL